MKKIVVFSGAGLSAESGLSTFRDSEDGLWNNFKIEDVATVNAWERNRQQCLYFYNQRHKELQTVKPNKAHKFLSKLQKDFEVYNITQNVDDLLERAGCANVLHLHGELTKKRSSLDKTIYDWSYDEELTISSVAPDGSAMRPHIVLFGEAVPNMDKAYQIVEEADIFVVIGTSLQVYPAAELLDCVKKGTPIFIINPDCFNSMWYSNILHIKQTATKGVDRLKKILYEDYL